MRFLVLYLLVMTVPVLIVAATAFRSQRAGAALGFLKKVGWGYAIAMVLLAGMQAWREWA